MPTIRQKKTAIILAENQGKSVSKAMLQAGYSPVTSKSPKNLTKSKSWPELMEKYFPDKFLTKKHRQLLEKKEYIAIGKPGEREVLETGEIDPTAVARGLDLAYKLKQKYPAEKSGGDTNVAIINIVKFGDSKPVEAKNG